MEFLKPYRSSKFASAAALFIMLFTSVAFSQSGLNDACFRLEGIKMECNGGAPPGACPTEEICKQNFCEEYAPSTGSIAVFVPAPPGTCGEYVTECGSATKAGDGCSCDCQPQGTSCKAVSNGLCSTCQCGPGTQVCADPGGSCVTQTNKACYAAKSIPMKFDGKCGCVCPANSSPPAGLPACGGC